MKKVEAAKWEAQRPIEKSEAKHAERMSEVERERYIVLKQVNDYEVEVQKLEAYIHQEKRKIAELRAAARDLAQDSSRGLEYDILVLIC